MRAPVALERFDGVAVNGEIQRNQVGIDFDDGGQHVIVVPAVGHAQAVVFQVGNNLDDTRVIVKQ